MRSNLQHNYNLDPVVADELQKRYFVEIVTTLRGLMVEQKIDPKHYLDYVHDITVADFIKPDVRLREVLASIPYQKSDSDECGYAARERYWNDWDSPTNSAAFSTLSLWNTSANRAARVHECARVVDLRGDEMHYGGGFCAQFACGTRTGHPHHLVTAAHSHNAAQHMAR